MSPLSVRLRNSLRKATMAVSLEYYRRYWGMDIAEGCRISHKAILDKSNPRGIHIGRHTGVALNAVILSHDFVRNRHVDTWIGERCHIGACSIIGAGVRIGDGCIVGTHFKVDGNTWNAVDGDRVKRFMDLVRQVR